MMRPALHFNHTQKPLLPALLDAVRKGNIKEIENLLRQGVDIEGTNAYGQTALILASSWQEIEMVHLLIGKGASINEKDYNDHTALICAAFRGHADIVRLLIDKNALLDEETNCGNTALVFAACRGYADIVQLLIDKGAALTTKKGKKALDGAIKSGDQRTIQILETAHQRIADKAREEKKKMIHKSVALQRDLPHRKIFKTRPKPT